MISRRSLPIRMKQVCASYGPIGVLHNVSWQIEPGSIVGLIGPTGGGKSTLLKVLARIHQIDHGNLKGIPKQRSLMFQEGALFDSYNVFDNVSFPLLKGNVPASRLSRADREPVSEAVFGILSQVGLEWAAHKMPGELSGGMRRRVSLARALVTRPALALLDDPTSGLDPVASSIILDLIVSLQEDLGSTMVIASHDLRRLIPRCHTLGCLFDGTLKFTGSIDSLREECSLEQIRFFVSCRYPL